jgi:Tfp pilus assembly ATPase PilU
VRINRTAEVELIMQRRETGNWQVTSLRDQELARLVVRGIIKQLPLSESEWGKQMRRQMQALPENLPQLPLP